MVEEHIEHIWVVICEECGYTREKLEELGEL